MQKLYYSISEVSKIVDEEQHILRYWEKEFDAINPKKNRAGNRVYSERDITIIKAVKKLLREDKLSLRGAKEQLSKFNFALPTEELVIGFETVEESVGEFTHKSNSDNKFLVNKLKELKSLLLEIKDSIST
ncbi:MAG: MerR family transcriptional regulator [Candidatus Kapabacteria bacterium]|nr:MerR family transcriptional regulator [Candidatus Kapabacteria bacterium]